MMSRRRGNCFRDSRGKRGSSPTVREGVALVIAVDAWTLKHALPYGRATAPALCSQALPVLQNLHKRSGSQLLGRQTRKTQTFCFGQGVAIKRPQKIVQ